MKFLLQTIKGKVVHDFVFEMEHAVEYQEWCGNTCETLYCELGDLESVALENPEEWTPVGTIEFVLKFIDVFVKKNGSEHVHPLNVPECLFPYAGRFIRNYKIDSTNRNTVIAEINSWNGSGREVFIKSNEKIKDKRNDFYRVKDMFNLDVLPNGDYQVSEYMEIVSEWRCFIYNGKMVGLQNYSGDFTVFPEVEHIKDYINVFMKNEGNENLAYTLDVVVDEIGETRVLEMHDFFSCGLYGFFDYKKLPYMFIRTFKNICRKLNNIKTN